MRTLERSGDPLDAARLTREQERAGLRPLPELTAWEREQFEPRPYGTIRGELAQAKARARSFRRGLGTDFGIEDTRERFEDMMAEVRELEREMSDTRLLRSLRLARKKATKGRTADDRAAAVVEVWKLLEGKVAT